MPRFRFGPNSTRELWIRSLMVVLTFVLLAGARSAAQGFTGTFVPIEVPGAPFTVARAITADGRIVGFFGVVNGPQHGLRDLCLSPGSGRSDS
jgi:hypothetical protein